MCTVLLDFLFPRRSLTGDEGVFITPAERRQLVIHPLVEDRSALRARGITSIDTIRAAMPYGKTLLVRKAITCFKYKRLPGFAEELAALIVAGCAHDFDHCENICLCPVPLHWTRLFQRGFNQAELLARAVAQSTNIPSQHLLRRVRPTGHQAWRNRAERLVGVRDAFACRATTPPAQVILIDDLATTGATLDACSTALKRAGAQWVEAWVLAHG